MDSAENSLSMYEHDSDHEDGNAPSGGQRILHIALNQAALCIPVVAGTTEVEILRRRVDEPNDQVDVAFQLGKMTLWAPRAYMEHFAVDGCAHPSNVRFVFRAKNGAYDRLSPELVKSLSLGYTYRLDASAGHAGLVEPSAWKNAARAGCIEAI